jgi:hypothetical protein
MLSRLGHKIAETIREDESGIKEKLLDTFLDKANEVAVSGNRVAESIKDDVTREILHNWLNSKSTLDSIKEFMEQVLENAIERNKPFICKCFLISGVVAGTTTFLLNRFF